MFDVFKLLGSLVLMCELILMNIFFLDLDKAFLPCFLLENINTISICFICCKTLPLYDQNELENCADVQWHDHQASIDHVKNLMIESIFFLKLLAKNFSL